MGKLSAVSSSYVARIVKFSEREIFMEYAQGQPLSEAVLPRDLSGIFREICAGLQALHVAGIIHRDIKPSNIMLCGGHIKIIDFDAARLKKPEVEKDTSFIGTDGFAPPEQYGFTQTDERSDIYALGVTMKLLLRDNYERSSLRHVAEKCMRFDPNRRYASAGAVSRAILLRKLLPAIISAAAVIAVCAAAVTLMSRAEPQKAPEAETTPAITASAPIIFETENIEVNVPQNSVRKASWSEAQNLPEKFPTLSENVTAIENETGWNAENTFRYSNIYWDRAGKDELSQYAAMVREWLNSADYDVTVVADGEDDGRQVHYSWVYSERGDWTVGGTIHLNYYYEYWERGQLELLVTLKNN